MMSKEQGINYDKIIRDEQNYLRAEDFRELNRLESSEHPSPGMLSYMKYLRFFLMREQFMKEHPPWSDFEREELSLTGYAHRRRNEQRKK